MKKVFSLIFTFFVLGINAQNRGFIDEFSFGMNYTLPTAQFYKINKKEKIISKSIESKYGFSLGLINVVRKTKPLQFIYGIEMNYLSSKYTVDYETPSFDPNKNKWQEHFIIQDNLIGNLKSVIISIPLLFRLNLINLKNKIPLFFDLGIKYDFLTVYNSSFEMEYYNYNSTDTYYFKEISQGETRVYNKRANLGVNIGIGTSIKQFSVKIAYTLINDALSTKVLKYYGESDIRLNYVNFSINFKLRK